MSVKSCYPQMHEIQYSLVVSTAPTSEPVTTADVKQHCRIEVSDEDDYVDELIQTAREMVEIDSERALLPQALTLTLDRFPEVIELRRCPVGDPDDIVIQYIDTAGDTQTLSADDYRVDSSSAPGRIAPAFGTVWPSTQCVQNSVTVTFPAGYDDADHVPAIAKHAIRMLVGHWYNNREAVGTVGTEIEQGYKALINRLRWGGYV